MPDEPLSGMELKAWRLARGLSQAALGKEMGYGWRTICQWEAGKKAVRKWVQRWMRGYDAERGQ